MHVFLLLKSQILKIWSQIHLIISILTWQILQVSLSLRLSDCSQILSPQGPASSPRVHSSSIPNLKDPSSTQPATTATRPSPWVKPHPPSSRPAAVSPEVPSRATARYVPKQSWSLTPDIVWSCLLLPTHEFLLYFLSCLTHLQQGGVTILIFVNLCGLTCILIK